MNVLVLAPHPDDEALGCGGTIRKHVLAGDVVTVAYVTNGEKGIPGTECDEAARLRRSETVKAAAVLGIHVQMFVGFPDGGLKDAESLPDALEYLCFTTLKPDRIYAPHGDDGHTDHATVGRLVRKIAGGRIALRFYEIWTPLARPEVIEDISDVVGEKRAAIRAYASQNERNGFVEGILALNHYRGILHGPHKMYAEAFGVA